MDKGPLGGQDRLPQGGSFVGRSEGWEGGEWEEHPWQSKECVRRLGDSGGRGRLGKPQVIVSQKHQLQEDWAVVRRGAGKAGG